MPWIRRGLLLLPLLLAGCGREPADPHGLAAADTFYFAGPDDLQTLFRDADYTVEQWDRGLREVPRFYLARVPSRWRHEVAPSLPTDLKKRYFFLVYTPLVLAANEEIRADRERLLRLLKRRRLDDRDLTWLRDLATRYGLAGPDGAILDDELRERLRRRVDIVPPSLALAQAAIESGWSTSRFTDEGNALFGQWTWDDDDSLAPQRRRERLGDYAIKAFASPAESVAAYMRNLNTHPSYRAFRRQRERLRLEGRRPDGLVLAPTLSPYAETGDEYVETLLAVMKANDLAPADRATLRPMAPLMLVPVGEGAD
ncbi:MAG: glucosaminidase domain-containing protein [Candidatus Krumholzibacteriia bacterium]